MFFALPKDSKIACFFDLAKVGKMTYSESESDFNFAINSESDSSESGSESDFSSVFMDLDNSFFFTLYLYSSK